MSISKLTSSSWWRRITPWWGITLSILAVSPFLKFVIPLSGITLATLLTRSGRNNWGWRLLAAPVLVFTVKFSAAEFAYSVAYVQAHAAASAATASGDEHKFARSHFGGGWCCIDDMFSPSYWAFQGWRDGAHAGLPPHAGDARHYFELLIKKGAKFSTEWWLRGPFRTQNGQIEQNAQFPSEKFGVILKGDEFDDADLKTLHLLGRFDYVEVNCPHITDDGLRHLLKVPPDVLRLRTGTVSQDLKKLMRKSQIQVWIGF